MPTYPYACTACDHRFEQVQAFSDPSLTECPVCGGRLRKVFSSVGIVFKGSGFYRNDSRPEASTSAGASEGGSGESSGSDATSSESSDTKSPDTKSPDTKSPDTKSPDTKSPDTKSSSAKSSSAGASSSGSTAKTGS